MPANILPETKIFHQDLLISINDLLTRYSKERLYVSETDYIVYAVVQEEHTQNLTLVEREYLDGTYTEYKIAEFTSFQFIVNYTKLLKHLNTFGLEWYPY